MEKQDKEGEIPVYEIKRSRCRSRAEHEEFCLNKWGPSHKAKYSLVTDSEPVLWRKGEKHFEQKSEIVPETMRLQAAGARKSDGVPLA